jgi:hypothetical protein
LRVIELHSETHAPNQFEFKFERFFFNQRTNVWESDDGVYKASMQNVAALVGYPLPQVYFTGAVEDEQGTTVGILTMGWISPYLRRAVLELDKVKKSRFPLEAGIICRNLRNTGGFKATECSHEDCTNIDWHYVFSQVKWDITVIFDNANVLEPSNDGYCSKDDLHKYMLHWRESRDLDREWRYHLLCVPQIAHKPFGIMYDCFIGDSNDVPREGAAIASHVNLGNDPKWGAFQNKFLYEATAVYFRTAVHEIGHLMHLIHNIDDNGFMNIASVIADRALNGQPAFPNNFQWYFSPEDQIRLRHFPDIWVRPGGIRWNASYGNTPISPSIEV